jgi:hypothetical protein
MTIKGTDTGIDSVSKTYIVGELLIQMEDNPYLYVLSEWLL